MRKATYTHVHDVMSSSIHIIDRLATVSEAIDLMREHQVSSLVINRRHEGDEFGLVVVTDIAIKIIGAELSPGRTNVYEIMSKPVVTVDVNMDIKYAIRLLGRLSLSRALVTDQGELVGLVTMRDMVLRYLRPEEKAAEAS